MAQALGLKLLEDLIYDKEGHIQNANSSKYHIPQVTELPIMNVIFVWTDEPRGPFGAKLVAEISIDGETPAVVSAVQNASGV